MRPMHLACLSSWWNRPWPIWHIADVPGLSPWMVLCQLSSSQVYFGARALETRELWHRGATLLYAVLAWPSWSSPLMRWSGPALPAGEQGGAPESPTTRARNAQSRIAGFAEAGRVPVQGPGPRPWCFHAPLPAPSTCTCTVSSVSLTPRLPLSPSSASG